MIKGSVKLLWIFLAMPYVYVAVIWKDLPPKLPMHFGANGEADRMGNKAELILVLLLMTGITLLSYYFTANSYKLDPKKGAVFNKEKLKKIALTVAFFTVFITGLAVYSITKGSANVPINMIFAGVGILYAIIGNYMHTLKPNYFAGIRVPWTLNDPENWRKTHLLAGKWWFWGGLLLAVLCLFATTELARIYLLSITATLCIVPSVYSYRLFAHTKKLKK